MLRQRQQAEEDAAKAAAEKAAKEAAEKAEKEAAKAAAEKAAKEKAKAEDAEARRLAEEAGELADEGPCPCFKCDESPCHSPDCAVCGTKEVSGCAKPEDAGCYTSAEAECSCNPKPEVHEEGDEGGEPDEDAADPAAFKDYNEEYYHGEGKDGEQDEGQEQTAEQFMLGSQLLVQPITAMELTQVLPRPLTLPPPRLAVT